jgi:hypothetical protein
MARFFGGVIFGEVHDLVGMHARIMRAYLLLVAFGRVEAGLIHHLVEARGVKGLASPLRSHLGRLPVAGSLARVVKNLLNYLIKLEAIVLGRLLLSLFCLGLTLILSLRGHILQDDALVMRCAILIVVVYHCYRCVELVEVNVVSSRVAWGRI